MKYKNISGRTLNVIGVGIVKPDGIIDVDKDKFNNANFEKVIKNTVDNTEKPAEQTAKTDK